MIQILVEMSKGNVEETIARLEALGFIHDKSYEPKVCAYDSERVLVRGMATLFNYDKFRGLSHVKVFADARLGTFGPPQ